MGVGASPAAFGASVETRLKKEELAWDSVDALHAAASALVDPVLAGADAGRWT